MYSGAINSVVTTELRRLKCRIADVRLTTWACLQVLQRGQELAGRLRNRQHELNTLQRIGAKEEVLKPVRDALASAEEEMKVPSSFLTCSC